IVLEGVADGITMQDPSGRVLYANGVAAQMCGYGSAEEMIAAPLADLAARFALFDADDRPLAYERVPNRRALAGGGPSALLVHVRDRSNGRDWWSQLVPRLGDWCAIELLEGRELRLLSVQHVDPAKVSLARDLRAKYPPDPKAPR